RGLRHRSCRRGRRRPRRAPHPEPGRPSRSDDLRGTHARRAASARSALLRARASRAPACAQPRPAGRARHGRRQARAPDRGRLRRTCTRRAPARPHVRRPYRRPAAGRMWPRGVAAGASTRALLHGRRPRRSVAMTARGGLVRLLALSGALACALALTLMPAFRPALPPLPHSLSSPITLSLLRPMLGLAAWALTLLLVAALLGRALGILFERRPPRTERSDAAPVRRRR